MRPPWRIVAAMATVLLVSCGSTASDAGRTDDRTEPGLVRVSSRFLHASDSSWTWIGATGTHLVGISGADTSAWGEVVDVGSGDRHQVEPPPVHPFEVLDVAILDASLVIVGVDQVTPGDDVLPPPAQRLSFRYSVEDQAWSAMDLPVEIAKPSTPAHAQLVASGPASTVGTFSTTEGRNAVAVADDEGWRLVTDLEDRPNSTWCATNDALWELSFKDLPERRADTAPYPTEAGLRRTALVDGTTEDARLPPIATDVGGAGVRLGCGADEPSIMTSSTLDGSVRPMLYARDAGGSWLSNPPTVDRDWLLGEAISGSSAAFTFRPVHRGIDPDDLPDLSAVILGPDGEMDAVPGSVEGRELHWLGSSSTLVMVGPSTTSDGLADVRLIETD